MTTKATASSVQQSRPLQGAARVGYVVDGILYLLIGALAIATVFGANAQADQQGALQRIASVPFGVFLLWVMAVGFAALVVFHVLTAVLERQTKERVESVGRAIGYGALTALTLGVVLGQGSSSGGPSSLSATILAQPAGVVLLLVVAAGIIALGVRNVIKGVKQKFTDDLRMPTGSTRRVVIAVGTVGYVAKGVALGTVGALFAVAALTSDSAKAGGLDAALHELAGLPFGAVLLAAVALGFIAFGVYCFVRARFARL